MIIDQESENVFVYKKCIIQNHIGMKCHDTCMLLLNGLQKKCVCTCVRTLTDSETRRPAV